MPQQADDAGSLSLAGEEHIHASSIAMTVCDLLPVDWPREQLRELLRFVNFFD